MPDLTLHKHQPKAMRQRVYDHMLRTRSWKYKAFLRHLRIFKYLAMAPVRGDFLESYYVLMRYLDDVVDGDAPLPEGYGSETDYMLSKIRFSQEPHTPVDEVDFMMLHCFDLARRFGQDFSSETKDILGSLLFDARRRDQFKVFPHEELMHHFHVLDIRGTIRATLKVFKEDPEKYLLLELLGLASRFQFDLEDYKGDIEAGYINISQEECEQFRLERRDFTDLESPKLHRWFCHRAEQGLEYLRQHEKNVAKGSFSLLARATFPVVYANPARRVFKHTLKTYG